MEQHFSEYTIERPSAIANSEMSNIRYMFKEIDQRSLVNRPSVSGHFAKRALDISISLLFIVFILSWLYPILAVLIKMNSRGPALFLQRRTGFHGREFTCYKFRTMYLNDEADLKQVAINDIRITSVGRFLRMTHLDETPQFLNVLLGDMSVVGPRPHMLYHTFQYAESIPYYDLRHEVKPGITGMAQIKDYIGEINGERELRKRIQWDIYYVKHRNLLLDLQIIATTFRQTMIKIINIMGVSRGRSQL